MKNILFTLVFVWGVIIPSAYAYIGFGICNFGKEIVDTVICYGPTVLAETTIKGDVKIAGPLKANKVSMGSMTIAGSAEIQTSTILGEADVRGFLRASYVNFEKNVTISATKAVLNHSIVKGSINFQSDGAKPNLKLVCGSIVEGSVIFASKTGVVQITDDSKINGKVDNGQLEFIKATC